MSNSAQQILAVVILVVAFAGFFIFIFVINRKYKK